MIDAVQKAGSISLDTCAFIYFFENHAEFAPLLKPVFAAIDDRSKRGVLSYLTLLEVLVKPLQQKRMDLVEHYRNALLENPGLELYAIDDEVAEEAAKIRAVHGFKTPDSIQLAVAKLKGAELFITNDEKLAKFKDLKVIVLGKLATKH